MILDIRKLGNLGKSGIFWEMHYNQDSKYMKMRVNTFYLGNSDFPHISMSVVMHFPNFPNHCGLGLVS